jgi:phage recombination protein Bet
MTIKKDIKQESAGTEKQSPQDTKQIQVIERIIENREIAPQDAFGKLSRPQIDLIKHTIAKGASDDELRMFIQVCKGANLNPFLKQVHLVPRWDSREGKEVRAIQVSIDGFRSIAESSGTYAGNDDAIFEGEQQIEYTAGKDGGKKTVAAPLKASVTVYKMVEGQRFPFSATARWTEYYPGAKMGFQWHVRPYLMLGKCAEALALRKAFPKLLSGMYAQEEMEQGSQANTEEKRAVAAFTTLKNALAKMSPQEIEEYKAKMIKSDKYTDDQKKEFTKLADERIAYFEQQ